MARSEKILLWLGVMLIAAVLLSLHMGRYPLHMGALAAPCRCMVWKHAQPGSKADDVSVF
ncbi:MAG: hypothetical protein QM665_12210 [Desulfovibrio sp.]